MSFWDHLEVLRWALFRSACVLAVIMVGTFIAMPYIFDRFILAPTSNDFFTYRWLNAIGKGFVKLSPDFDVQIININVASQFMTHISTSVSMAAVIAFPYFIWEIWKFVAPALYENEKKAVRGAFSLSSALFYLGVAVGYFVVLPVCLMFFVNFSVSDAIVNTISLSSYMSLFTSMVFLIGILFEFPSVILALSSMGVISRSQLKSWRKYAIVVVLILAALITPSDPFSMFVLAIPLYGLFELSVLLCKK